MILYAALQSQKANQIIRVLKNKRNPNKFLVDLLQYFIADNSEWFLHEWIFVLKLIMNFT